MSTHSGDSRSVRLLGAAGPRGPAREQSRSFNSDGFNIRRLPDNRTIVFSTLAPVDGCLFSCMAQDQALHGGTVYGGELLQERVAVLAFEASGRLRMAGLTDPDGSRTEILFFGCSDRLVGHFSTPAGAMETPKAQINWHAINGRTGIDKMVRISAALTDGADVPFRYEQEGSFAQVEQLAAALQLRAEQMRSGWGTVQQALGRSTRGLITDIFSPQPAPGSVLIHGSNSPVLTPTSEPPALQLLTRFGQDDGAMAMFKPAPIVTAHQQPKIFLEFATAVHNRRRATCFCLRSTLGQVLVRLEQVSTGSTVTDAVLGWSMPDARRPLWLLAHPYLTPIDAPSRIECEDLLLPGNGDRVPAFSLSYLESELRWDRVH